MKSRLVTDFHLSPVDLGVMFYREMLKKSKFSSDNEHKNSLQCYGTIIPLHFVYPTRKVFTSLWNFIKKFCFKYSFLIGGGLFGIQTISGKTDCCVALV